MEVGIEVETGLRARVFTEALGSQHDLNHFGPLVH